MRPVPRTATALASVLILAGLAAGCAQKTTGTGSSPGQPGDSTRQAFDKRAAQVAKAWEASGNAQKWQHGFIPLTGLTLAPNGDGTAATKFALVNGWYRLRAPLPHPMPQGTITFPDGSAMTVPLEPAQDAYQQIATAPPAGCGKPEPLPTAIRPVPPITSVPPSAPDGGSGTSGSSGGQEPCTVLTITRIALGSDQLLTSRGEATVPGWQFTVSGLDKPVERVAVDPSAITQSPVTDGQGGRLDNIAAGQSLASAGGTALTFRVTLGDCDKNVTPLVYEDTGAVVVGASYTNTASVCDDMALIKSFDVTLSAPVGARVVLDVVSGNPLTVSTLP